mgnify:CR=1 FL=1
MAASHGIIGYYCELVAMATTGTSNATFLKQTECAMAASLQKIQVC